MRGTAKELFVTGGGTTATGSPELMKLAIANRHDEALSPDLFKSSINFEHGLLYTALSPIEFRKREWDLSHS